MNIFHPIIIRFFILLGLIFPALASAAYTDNGNGTVTDTATGLTWMRCSMGQTWTGSTCTGTASTYTWDQANALTGTVSFAGKNDWYLPSITELQSRVNIDPAAFPNTIALTLYIFWSATAYPNSLDSAWYIISWSGVTTASYRGNPYQVRLVRAGQSFGSFALTATPSGTGSGTVTSSTGSINCGSACSASFSSGSSVVLTATPASGSTFAGWGGACTGTGVCAVTMNAAKNVTATFSTAAFAITDAQVFTFAEANYPSIFTGTGTAGQYQQYNYRHYPASGNYLAVDTAGEIFVLGPYTGGVITSVGTVAVVAPTVTAWEATQCTSAQVLTNGVCVTPAATGYVSQGGLTWMPVTFTKNWADANAYCTGTTINGQSGWRLPTNDELVSLYNSGALVGAQGWTLSYTWSSAPDGGGFRYYVDLSRGVVGGGYDTYFNYVTCVR